MNSQLLLLALGSAMFPLLLAIVLVLLTADNPPKLLAGYLIGGYPVSFAWGVLMILVVDKTDLASHTSHKKFGPGVDIVVGILAIVVAVLLERLRRKRTQNLDSHVARQGSGNARVDAILDRGSIKWMILLGAILSMPSPFYISAAKDIAQQDPSWSTRIGILIVFNIIVFLLVWVPLVSYLVSPGKTRNAVQGLNLWLQNNLLRVGVLIAIALGIYEIIRGLVDL
jgi:hypothetical protein